MDLSYLSICSGIEAATVAWQPLGLHAVGFSEIEKFPSEVLAHRHPTVTNYGDISNFRGWDIDSFNILVGGTPCQSFSIAGRRKSLSDARGNLSLVFCQMVDHYQPEFIVWENVPGVLNTRDNAFGCLLAGLAGESVPLVPSGKKWTNAGVVYGPERTVEWRVLDAQYFGVAQRRRRVFVVGYPRGRCSREVLFEFEGVRRDLAPSRKKKKALTGTVESGVIIDARGRRLTKLIDDFYERPSGTITARTCVSQNNIEDLVLDLKEVRPNIYGFRMSAFGQYEDDETASTLKARDYKDATDLAVLCVNSRQDPIVTVDASLPLGAKDQGHAIIAIQGNMVRPNAGCNGKGWNKDDLSYTLTAADRHAVALYVPELDLQRQECVIIPRVRRLTPVECERLQGFPDNYTQIPWNGKPAELCPEGHRYKVLGNSMAVPVMRWIGERILKAF